MMMMMMKWKDLTWAIDKTNIFAPKDGVFQWESPFPEVYFQERTVNFRESISIFFLVLQNFRSQPPTGLSPAETRRPKAVELYKSHQDKISWQPWSEEAQLDLGSSSSFPKGSWNPWKKCRVPNSKNSWVIYRHLKKVRRLWGFHLVFSWGSLQIKPPFNPEWLHSHLLTNHGVFWSLGKDRCCKK